MKCADKRQLLAALAANALEPARETDLRLHLRSCSDCKQYLHELTSVTENLRAASKVSSDIETSESFHGGLMARLTAEPAESGWRTALFNLRAMLTAHPRMALTSALILVLAIPFLMSRHTDASSTHFTAVEHSSGPRSGDELAPSLSNYQLVANRSFERLDQLLTVQGTRGIPSPPTYTADARSLAKQLE